MPGLLTAERRERAKNRSRTNQANKRTLDSKITKNKTPYHGLKIDTVDPRTMGGSSLGTNSLLATGNSLGTNSILADPRTITPTTSSDSPSRSSSRSRNGRWKDFDESTADSTVPHSPSSSMGSPAKSQAYSFDEDMPMDEMMGRGKQQTRSPKSVPSSPKPTSEATYRSVTPTKEVSDILGLSNIMAMVSPSNWNTTDGGEDYESKIDKKVSMDSADGMSIGKPPSSPSRSTTGIQRIIAALNSGSTASRPHHLSREECILWDSLQTAMVNDRNEHLSKRRALERDLEKSSTLLDEVAMREMELEREVTQAKTIRADMEQKYIAMAIVVEKQQARKNRRGGDDDNISVSSAKDTLHSQLQQINQLKQELQAKDTIMKEQQDSHNTEVLAIQRVLADVTTEKIKLLQETSGDVANKEGSGVAVASEEEMEAARRVADRKSEETKVLESDLKDARLKIREALEDNEKLLAENKAATVEVASLKGTLESLKASSGINELKAEVSHQKFETEKLKVEKMESQVAHTSAMSEVKKLKTENELARQEVEKWKQGREQAATEVAGLTQEKELLQKNTEKLARELEELRKARGGSIEAKAPSSSVDSGNEEGESTIVSLEEFEKLQQTLGETALSLETSKKIIASLENANGSLAVDSRSKLKEKEEELSIVQKESEERKRNLDSLATELRDLQRKQGNIESADRRAKVQLIRQQALMDHLETTLSDLQEAVVVHESTVAMYESGVTKNSNIEEISEILGDALHAITATIETSEQFVDEVDDSSDVEYPDVSSEVGRHIDAVIRNDREAASRGLKHELDQKKVAVKRLEEALKKQNEEMRRMRAQFYTSDNNQLRTEIQRLRQQCTTNLEVLAKKERELSVLRSSLKVDENESGYISDDASDEEDDDVGTDVGSIISAAKLSGYGPADVEAYATILAQASGKIAMPGNVQMQEIESLKRDLMEALGEKELASKELQARHESLANAKMIISSLEKANKGMMEDLRSRLQDSNTAISSLLDKSKEQENTANDLREKLRRLEQAKLEERGNYEAEIRKLRNESENRQDGEEVSLEEKKE